MCVALARTRAPAADWSRPRACADSCGGFLTDARVHSFQALRAATDGARPLGCSARCFHRLETPGGLPARTTARGRRRRDALPVLALGRRDCRKRGTVARLARGTRDCAVSSRIRLRPASHGLSGGQGLTHRQASNIVAMWTRKHRAISASEKRLPNTPGRAARIAETTRFP